MLIFLIIQANAPFDTFATSTNSIALPISSVVAGQAAAFVTFVALRSDIEMRWRSAVDVSVQSEDSLWSVSVTISSNFSLSSVRALGVLKDFASVHSAFTVAIL